MIKNFKPRLYQEVILATASKKNTLIVLPTGMGKTNVFLMIAANRLANFPKGKIVLIGPTKPLIDQYFKVFNEHFEMDKDRMAIMTGQIKPEKRVEKWASSQIIFTTPQGFENDVMKGAISLADVTLMGFDEAHRAVGDYSYVRVADRYIRSADFPRVVGMTASPGSDREKIEEICNNLSIEEIEVRNEEDPDVKPYIQEVDRLPVKVKLPESFMDVRKDIERCIATKVDHIRKISFIKTNIGMGKGQLLKLQAQISRGRPSGLALRSLSLIAEAVKASHALELLESQGIEPLKKYMDRLQEDVKTTKVKALKNLLADANFQEAIRKTDRLYEKGEEHPKLREVVRIIREEVKTDSEKVIIFSQFRDSALTIKKSIERETRVKAGIFVGQAKRGGTGLSQKEQKRMLQDFRDGAFNVLIATSIGEEGLDIVKVDTVIFYEPTPSAIRSIQRRGRTGRQEKGRVIILIAENTRDEAMNWVSQRKEQKMYRLLREMKNKIGVSRKEKLTGYFGAGPETRKVKIFADRRENGSLVKALSDRNVDLEVKTLEVADYVCSGRVGVEVKTCNDFVSSITDGRILNQARGLKDHYERPLIIIQGDPGDYGLRSIHPNAIRGMIASITVDYGIPVISTRNEEDTAELLITIARREQENEQNELQNHSRKPMATKELQEYFLSALPGVETKTARALLKEFRNVKNVINAPEELLKKTEFIGDKKASEIRKVLDTDYSQD